MTSAFQKINAMNKIEMDRLQKVATLGEKKFIVYVQAKTKAPYFSNALFVAFTHNFKNAVETILEASKSSEKRIYYAALPSLSAYLTLIGAGFEVSEKCFFATVENKDFNKEIKLILNEKQKKESVESLTMKLVDHAMTANNLELASALLE